MSGNVGMSVDGFKQELRQQVESICKDLGKSYDNAQERGYAFEIWLAQLLLKEYSITEADPQAATFLSNDLKVDIGFDDDETKTLVLAQTKFVSLGSNPDIKEDEVAAFFDRHEVFLKQQEWVRQHASDELSDIVIDYAYRADTDWTIDLYFVSTGKASDRVKELVSAKEREAKKVHQNVNFYLWDFYALKEEYIKSLTVEAAISDAVEIQFQQDKYLIKNDPHRTVLSIIKGNTLAALYRKERERLFAYNIRSFLGRRANQNIITTANRRPDDFYYFNNGVSAVCTHIKDLGKGRFRFENFQIINGAQTVGSLAQTPNLDTKCEVVLRVTEGASVKTEKGFNADIIRFNNTQNVVKLSDFRSNDEIQLWLEKRFEATKARGALSQPIRYVRKRSDRRVRGAITLKFEELAKIRYSYFYEPTQAVADPRSLWTSREDSGLYEKAFGIDGELLSAWTENAFEETLFATIVFLKIMQRIKEHIRQDKSKYFFLQRLRYWALALARVHLEKKKIRFEELLSSEKKLNDWFSEFWGAIFRDLINAYQSAQEAKISNFALARNEKRWNTTRETVDMILGAGL